MQTNHISDKKFHIKFQKDIIHSFCFQVGYRQLKPTGSFISVIITIIEIILDRFQGKVAESVGGETGCYGILKAWRA